MFLMVLERLFLPDLQKVSGHSERRICAVGVTKILTETPMMLQGEYEAIWYDILSSEIECVR
jgi:exportin-2 (importin alpha re-exporter)